MVRAASTAALALCLAAVAGGASSSSDGSSSLAELSAERVRISSRQHLHEELDLASCRESHDVALAILSRGASLAQIVGRLDALESKMAAQATTIDAEAARHHEVCATLSAKVKGNLAEARAKEARAKTSAGQLERKIAFNKQRKDEKALLLLQLKLTRAAAAPDLVDAAAAADIAAVVNDNPSKSTTSKPKSKAQSVVKESLESDRKREEVLDVAREAAADDVASAHARTVAIAQHLADLTQECSQRNFLFDMLQERAKDHAAAVEKMLSSVKKRRIDIKAFLDSAKEASGGARLPPALAKSAQENGGCLWACAEYKLGGKTFVNDKKFPKGAICTKCSEDGIVPLPPNVVNAMSEKDGGMTVSGAVALARSDLQSLASAHALRLLDKSFGSGAKNPSKRDIERLFAEPSSPAALKSGQVQATHAAAVNQIKKDHAKALAQIKQAVTMAFMHQNRKGGKHSADGGLADALAVAQAGAVELLHATHEEALARVQSQHRSSLNRVSAEHKLALKSAGMFGAADRVAAEAEKVRQQHADAVSAVVKRHKHKLADIAAKMEQRQNKAMDAVDAVQRTHGKTAEEIANTHESAVDHILSSGNGNSDGNENAVPASPQLLSGKLHGVEGEDLLVPAKGLELALDSSLLMCRFSPRPDETIVILRAVSDNFSTTLAGNQ